MSSNNKRNILIAATLLFLIGIFLAKNNYFLSKQNLNSLRWDLSQKHEPENSDNQNKEEEVLSGRTAIVFEEARPATV